MTSRSVHSAGSLFVACLGVTQFMRIVRDVRFGESSRYDEPVRRFVQSLRDPHIDTLSKAVVALTAPAVLVPITLTIAIAIRKRGAAAWLPIAISPLLALTAGAASSEFLPQQLSPDDKGDFSFPSGHTTGVTAEVLATTYVLARENWIRSGAGALLCTFPIVAGINRVYRDRHWASDVLAGWAAGVTVAALCAFTSEQLR